MNQRKATTLFRYSPGLILVAIAVCDLGRFADPDLWGHVRFGQEVLRLGHIVWRDPYSYTAPGHLWLNHEWLTEVVMGASFNLAGVFGLKLMKLACATATILFITAALGETGAATTIQFGVLLTSAVTMAPYVQFRPQSFTFVLLSALLWMMTRELRGKRAMLWLAVPMLALWANLHGGFILGVVTLAIFAAVSGAQSWFRGDGWSRAMRLAAIATAGAAATLVTPYGIGTWHAVIHALRDPYTRIVVIDWQPMLKALALNWHTDPASTIYYLAAMAMMTALAASFAIAPAADDLPSDLPMCAIAAVMSAAAFVAVRNIPVAVIALATPLAFHLSLAVERVRPAAPVSPNMPAAEKAPPLHQAVLAIVAIAVLWGGHFFSNRLGTVDPYPVSACEFMKNNSLKGNVLSLFGWGEYLIWHLAPESKVFVDGRYDTVYPQNVLEDYFVFNFNQSGGDRALKAYRNDFVLISPTLPGRKIVDADPHWRLIYKDATSLLYARADSAAAAVSPVTGTSQSVNFP